MKAYIHTFGCKVNQYDAQVLRERLEFAGYSFSDNINNVDLALINSCTVTGEAFSQLLPLMVQRL